MLQVLDVSWKVVDDLCLFFLWLKIYNLQKYNLIDFLNKKYKEK